jgi:hypothetical protein
MAYSLAGFYPDQRGAGHRIHTYTSADLQATVAASGYFDSLSDVLAEGDKISCLNTTDNVVYDLLVSDITSGVVTTVGVSQELTASGAVTAGAKSVELNHATVVIAATIADFKDHQGLFVVKDTSASGTAAHTLTLTSGTFDGTNSVATLNAPNECLVVWVDSAGNGTIVENVGTVALS